jgi:predicted phosphodiesterase
VRVLVISDIHGNLSALETVIADALLVDFCGAKGFDSVWCLGDIVGYGPDPNACIELLGVWGDHLLCVAGNHDWAVLGRLPLEDFNSEAREAALWTRKQLSDQNRKDLEQLPSEPVTSGEYTITHASPRHPVWEYISSPFVARDNFAHFDTRFCWVGHTHVPMIYMCDGHGGEPPGVPACRGLSPAVGELVSLGQQHRLVLNPGSVGQPRDNDPRASYVLLDTESNVIIYRRVSYPYELTQARMRAAQLPDRLIARLAYGW